VNAQRGRQFGFSSEKWTAGMPSMVTKSVPTSHVVPGLFDPSGPELEAGMNDGINSPFQPDRASWSRFEAACAHVQAVYTKSA
jgi:hypothetical protein